MEKLVECLVHEEFKCRSFDAEEIAIKAMYSNDKTIVVFGVGSEYVDEDEWRSRFFTAVIDSGKYVSFFLMHKQFEIVNLEFIKNLMRHVGA